MKACLRLFLALLISFALPLNGMAAPALSAQPCQMQDGMDMSAHAGHPSMTQDDGGHSHKGNPLCDSDHQCKTGSMLQAGVVKPAVATAPPLLGSAYPDFFPARSGVDVWRPPRH
ncbi:hypothetical protein [Pseudomonas lopnurensis]|uniref:hypothetical protein n=1 Tax=Pseudomonas lopnurensis TaxID=1477517 RepID=UPI00187A8BBD|nr:hypothetical protein [Pseudomonas lopnurensis]MBE7377153.1 hypothetical protein [Pseudomonas lopnurensis]